MLPACAAGIALVAYLAATVYRDVHDGIPESVRVSAIEARCAADGRACDARLIRLNPGRFYLRTIQPARGVTIAVTDAAAAASTRVLLLRAETPGRVAIGGGPASPALVRDIATPRVRTIIDVAAAPSGWNQITFTPTDTTAPVVLREIGFFESDRDLRQSSRTPVHLVSAGFFYATVAAAVTFAICGFICVAAWIAPRELYGPAPWLVAILCACVCVLELGTIFSPYWSFDLRTFYGEELVVTQVGGNVTGGLSEGTRIVQGLGQTIAPGFVQWHRMPGYGWFCALAALVGGSTDLVDTAMTVIVLQMLIYSAAVGLFVRVARGVLGLEIAVLLGVLITLLPKQLNYTEVDAIIAPVSLTVLGVLLIYLSQSPNGGPARLPTFLLLNAACAAWFLLRNDILPGWIALSIVLAGRRWRRLVVPLLLIAAIALPWAIYKRQYRHEFNLMPTNTGEVLLLSLCEAPGAFPYACTDDGYGEWARKAGHADPSTQAASDAAALAAVRHWATYPVHFGFMIWYKLRRAVSSEAWPGVRMRLNFLYGIRGLFVALLAVVGVALAVGHARRRTLLLGWALVLNLPIFLVVFASSGRFYSAAGISLIAAAVPLLVERGFYAAVRRRPWRAAIVVACCGLFLVQGQRLEDLVLSNDAIHYWAPLLDPHGSSLEFVGH